MANVSWISTVVSLSTACIVEMWEGIMWYACIRASSSTLREDSSPVLIVMLSERRTFVYLGSMMSPNDKEAYVVPADFVIFV